MSKLPLAIILAHCWYEQIKNRYLIAVPMLPLILILITVGTYKQIKVMDTAPTALHFKKIPQEYRIASNLKDIHDSIILSDPYTSYMLSGLTDNKTYTVDSNRVSDYDQKITQDRNKFLYEFYENPNTENLNRMLKDERIDYIVINKTFSVNSANGVVAREPLQTTKLTDINNSILKMDYFLFSDQETFSIYKKR
jgi:hypothetical protein